jgi:hypothetical protein
MGLLSRLFKRSVRDDLVRLERGYQSERPAILDPDIELILMTGQCRDSSSAARLLQRYNVQSPHELMQLLPKRRPVPWRRRLYYWLLSLEGSYAHPPHSTELREVIREHKRNQKRLGRLRI